MFHKLEFVLVFLITVDFPNSIRALNLEQCNQQLGMEDGSIPDSAITASSTHHAKSVGPQNARIRMEKHGGAWCPLGLINKDSYEYLQIDLGQLMVITKVEVQGRFANGQGIEYAEHFLLEYQREDGGEWIRFRDKFGKEIFEGNKNNYLEELRDVSPPIIGRRVKFIPFSQNQRQVCMRVEMYGCPWQDGTVSYDTRQGDSRGTENSFLDFTYDGTVDHDRLYGGLGQLTDGELGDANFRLESDGTPSKGFEWVGWRNDTPLGEGPVEITFKFENVRNFSSVLINCNNYFTKNVRVFRKAELYFSVGGVYFPEQPVTYEFQRDTVMDYNHEVEIDLKHNIGRYVKLKLYFDAKWMMISEVHFVSVALDSNVSVEELPPTTPKPITTTTVKDVKEHVVVGFDVDGYIDKIRNPKPELPKESSASRVPEQTSAKDEDYISIIIGALAALIVILTIVVVFVIIRHKRRQNDSRNNLKPAADNVLAINLNNFHGTSNGKVSNGNVYNGVATDEEHVKELNGSVGVAYEDIDDIKPPLFVALPPITNNYQAASNYQSTTNYQPASNQSSNGYQPASNYQQANGYQHTSVKSIPSANLNSLDKPPTYDALYAAADVINSTVPNIPSLQGVSGNNVYAVPNSDLLVSSVDVALVEFPRRNLRFVEVLGEGEFGEVHLCEALGVPESIDDHFMINRRASGPTLVAVKILRKNADDRARADFHREMKVMSMLKDRNIVRVLGVCTREEPLCMIVEYMRFGDLNQFLMDHVPEGGHPPANAKVLSYGCQIYMACQIASGMKYLESLNMVHRDLATRNCLVGTYCTIKISDFGMSRSLYSADYYRIEGRAVLPIRWMAWESILLGKFTCKSDVWSFAVTLWEILTFAREQPFETLSDEQVIENAGHYYRNDNEQIYHSHPPICPKEIYDLMLECWNRQESERPSFREIHMFLMRKNMGYDPRKDNLEHVGIADVSVC